MGVLNNFGELDALMLSYDVRTCVIDGLPNTHSAKEFAGKFPGRVWLCYYANKGTKAEAVWNSDERVKNEKKNAIWLKEKYGKMCRIIEKERGADLRLNHRY